MLNCSEGLLACPPAGHVQCTRDHVIMMHGKLYLILYGAISTIKLRLAFIYMRMHSVLFIILPAYAYMHYTVRISFKIEKAALY